MKNKKTISSVTLTITLFMTILFMFNSNVEAGKCKRKYINPRPSYQHGDHRHYYDEEISRRNKCYRPVRVYRNDCDTYSRYQRPRYYREKAYSYYHPRYRPVYRTNSYRSNKFGLFVYSNY